MHKTKDQVKIFPSVFLLLSLIFMGMSNVQAQSVATDSIKTKKYISVDVPKTYERIIAKGYDSIELFDYLGNYYYSVNNLEKSKLYFDLLFKKYKISQISAKSIEIYKNL